MRQSMTLRWIEQAEARQVLTAACFERAPKRSRSTTIYAAVADGLSRLRGWLVPQGSAGWSRSQVQPALARQPVRGAERRPSEYEDYSCYW